MCVRPWAKRSWFEHLHGHCHLVVGKTLYFNFVSLHFAAQVSKGGGVRGRGEGKGVMGIKAIAIGGLPSILGPIFVEKKVLRG